MTDMSELSLDMCLYKMSLSATFAARAFMLMVEDVWQKESSYHRVSNRDAGSRELR